jgi:hypothetical protein
MLAIKLAVALLLRMVGWWPRFDTEALYALPDRAFVEWVLVLAGTQFSTLETFWGMCASVEEEADCIENPESQVLGACEELSNTLHNIFPRNSTFSHLRLQTSGKRSCIRTNKFLH